MSTEKICPCCGKALRPSAPEGLCPACLLACGLAGEPQPGEVEAAASAPFGIRVFGDYELLEEIARGGMGVVHKARQISLNRIVALKLILGGPLAGREQAQRFHAEAQAAAQLQHPHIVAIHEVGEHAGQLYFSMDYIEGCNLAQIISNLGFEISNYRRSAQWMKTVAEAVHYAHQHGILHRDLKPANIIIDQHDLPHVTDFGLAKRFAAPLPGGPGEVPPGSATTAHPGPAEIGTTDDLTLSGQVLGSPSYLSPEQAEGKRGGVGVASDVYSLGAILYHLLTGRPPFQGETLTALLRQVIETDPVAPRLLNPSIPRDLETICLKCLEKGPRQRYPSAQELADELGRFLANEPVRARRVGRPERAWRWCRRNPKLAGAIGLAVVALVIGVAGIAWQWRRAEAGELLALQRAYVSDMDLATRALAEDDFGRVRELLTRYQPRTERTSAPAPGSGASIDLRGWEWQYLWQKSRSQAAFRLCTRRRQVSSLAFTADGQRLVVHERRGLTLVYDLATRQPVPGLVQTNLSWRMAFCPARNRVAYQLSPESLADGEVHIWDLQSNSIVSRLGFTNDDFSSFAFSPDAQRLAGFTYLRGVQMWDLANGGQVKGIPAEPGAGTVWTGEVAFDPTGNLLAVGHRQHGVIRLHHLPGGEIEAEFRLPAEEVLTLAWSPDGRWLAASAIATNPVVRVWPLPAGEPMELTGQKTAAFALAFDPRSEILAGGDGQTIRLWDLAGRCLLTKLVGHRSSVAALAFSPDGQWLASGSNASGTEGGEVLLWELARLRRPEQPDYQVLSNVGLVAFERDSRSFLALADRIVTRFEIDTLRPIEPLLQYGTNNCGLAVSWDGHWLAHAERDGLVHLWDTERQREQTSFCPYPGTCPQRGTMRILARGRFLATRADSQALHIWETASWRQPEPWRSLNAFARGACITADDSRDGRFLATGHAEGQVILWETVTGRRLASFDAHREPVMEVAFSPDGRWLASAGWDGALRLWDVRHRREAGSFRGSETPAYGITFSPDGRRVVNGGLAGSLSVVIWDVTTRQHLADLVGPGMFFFSPRFSPDGRTLAVWGYMRDVTWFWRVPALADIDAGR